MNQLTPLPCIRINRLLVLLVVLKVGCVVRSGDDLLLRRDRAARLELRVVRDVLAAVARHAARVLAGALVPPFEQREVVFAAMPRGEVVRQRYPESENR